MPIIEQLLNLLQPLPVPVPPQLERALGYGGDSRFVAFYWIPDGDELMFEDVRLSGTGEWSAWVSYTTHRLVAPHLEGLNFGNAEEVAELYFVLDRQERRAYAGDIMPVMRLLAQQHLVSNFEEVESLANIEEVQADETQVSDAPAVDAPAAKLPAIDAVTELQAAMNFSTWQQVTGPDSTEVQRLMAQRQQLEAEMNHWLDTQMNQQAGEESGEQGEMPGGAPL